MALQILQGATGYVNPSVSILDTGWTISGIYAIHSSCNAGLITSKSSLGLIVGRQYTFTYTVDNYINGTVQAVAGSTAGTVRSAAGTYTETLTVTGAPVLSFYSDGSLRISVLSFYDTETGPTSGTTIQFNEGANQWGSDQSYQPDLMIKFLDQFMSVKNGGLWAHDTNDLTGNFYGVQYPAMVTFVVNVDYKKDKIFYNFRVDGKGKWYAPNLTTVGSNQFPNGMKSRLKKNNFSQIDGKLWSAIMGDLLDPNFATSTEVEALFKGRRMQGGWLICQFQCDDMGDVDFSSVEVYYDEVFRAF